MDQESSPSKNTAGEALEGQPRDGHYATRGFWKAISQLGLRRVKGATGGKVVPAPPQLGGGTHHAGVGKADPCAGLLRVKLFIDFAHFGPGRGKVRVVGLQRGGGPEARRTGPAGRPHPEPASIHRVTGAILGSAIPAPSPPSSTSKTSGKNHMNSVLVPLNPQRRERTPWPSASRRRGGWARDLHPAACRAPLRGDPSECAGGRAGAPTLVHSPAAPLQSRPSAALHHSL